MRSGIELDARVIEVADYIIDNECTLREVAPVFNIGKSTAHVYMTTRLQWLDMDRYSKVMKILEYNKSIRYRRGGLAAKYNCPERREKLMGENNMMPVMLMTTVEKWVKDSGLEVTDKVIGKVKSELIAVHPKYYHHAKITKVINERGGVDFHLLIRYSETEQYYITDNVKRAKRIIDILSDEHPRVTRSLKESLEYSRKLGGNQ